MKKALNILKLPIVDLENFVIDEMEKNPLLEKIEDEITENFFPKNSSKNFSKTSNSFDPFYNIAKKKSLQEHLNFQAREFFSKKYLKIATYIIGNLNERGFLDVPIEDIAKDLKTPKKEVLKVLKKIQTFDPIGIAARNLQERILIQLISKNKKNSLCFKIIKNNFDDFIKSKKTLLMKIFKISKKSLKEAIKDLKKNVNLNVTSNYVTSNYLENRIEPIIPDIFIRCENSKWKISINKKNIPNFQINEKYKNLLKNPLKKEEKDFIKKNILSGNLLKTSLKNRFSYLKEIASLLIKTQKNFFLFGDRIAPLSYQKTADKLKVHLSTIYRIVFDKYIDTPIGIFPLKSFFSSEKKIFENKISKREAFSLLKEIIQKENKKNPLSDDKISKMFLKRGISISRRTICKYRKKLFLESSNKRNF
jgi:RNA polymerase sigma-54 factor